MSEESRATAPRPPIAPLAALRARIDALDSQIHDALIERSEVIDALVVAKRLTGGAAGGAFRPGREAEVMRTRAAAHRGSLPFPAVENLWRIIISTFTYLQQPYRLHVAGLDQDASMRDVARFQFGFSVPLVSHTGPHGAVAALLEVPGDLALVALEPRPVMADVPPWWAHLSHEGPRVMARLPAVDAAAHPMARPALVLSGPIDEPIQPEVTVYAVRGGAADDPTTLPAPLELLAVTRVGETLHRLVAGPARLDDDPSIAATLADGAGPVTIRPVGGYFLPATLPDPISE
ncbi:chorismate mutase [Segnochrobactraceae bacterium EtOH-i3]